MTGQTHEHRKVARQKALLRGKLYFNNRLSVVDCTIRDISEGGARLVYSEAVVTPDELELHIPQKNETVKVRIVWRRGYEVGVAFEPIANTNRPFGPEEIAARFARLEAEIADLKRVIKKLKIDSGPEAEVV